MIVRLSTLIFLMLCVFAPLPATAAMADKTIVLAQYCQIEAGKEDRGPYHKTGRQIPCGPAFQKKRAQEESCPVPVQTGEIPGAPRLALARVSLLDDETLPRRLAENDPAQAKGRSPGAGLFVGGKEVQSQAAVSGLAAFLTQGNAELRKTVFAQMKCHLHRRFAFKSAEDLMNNIKIREGVVAAMNDIRTSKMNLSFAASHFMLPTDSWEGFEVRGDFGGGVRQRNWVWLPAPPHEEVKTITFRTQPGVKASTAIASFVKGDAATLGSFGASRLDCLMGVQMAVLAGVKRALGAGAFDTLHPAVPGKPELNTLYGIGIPILINGAPAPFETSPNQHLIPVRWSTRADADPSYIAVADMVVGDYAYIANPPSYSTYHQGAWAGENSIYMKSGLFYGLGLAAESLTSSGLEPEAKLREQLTEAYNEGLLPAQRSSPDKVRWTLLASPVRDGDKDEAGLFVAPAAQPKPSQPAPSAG